MIEKRLSEIQSRKLEIRQALTENADINLEEIQNELEELETETRSLTEKIEIANKINTGEIEARTIEMPSNKEEKRMENKFASAEYRQNFMNYVLKGEKIADNVLII